MKILFGLISADTGKIFFDGQEKTNNQLGALIEAPAIYMNLSAFDNLCFLEFQIREFMKL